MRRRAGNHPVVAAEQRLAHVDEGLLDDRGAAISRALRHSARKSAMNLPTASSTSAAVALKRNARDRLARGEREQRRLRLEPMQRGTRIEQILPVLPIRPGMDLDQQSAPQAGDPDRGGQMIDGRGREDGEPDRLEAGRFLQIQSRERPVELYGLQKTQPMAGQRGQAFKAVAGLGLSERRAQIVAEIARERQPAHRRTSGGGALRA